MKIALVHDYLIQLGGAEKVLESFHEIFKESPIFVLIYNKKKMGHIFKKQNIKTSWLQKFPLSVKKYQWYLVLMPKAVESYKLNNYDIVLSSISSLSKGIKLTDNILHICYCHTPTRYLWYDVENYIKELGYNKLIKKIIPLFLKHLKYWDFMASQRVDKFIANSITVQKRIKQYYGRDSIVIYPPVETDKFYISEKQGNYYLIGGRLVPYKRYDLAIQAFNKLGIKLKIFGDGLELKKLKSIAKKNIEFLGHVNDKEKAKLYSECIAFIYPQIEDFGITAIEAMASGRPVIAYSAGGALETIIPHQTGEFFSEQNWESLADNIIHFKPEKYNSNLIKNYSEKFNKKRFQKEIKEFVETELKKFEMEKIFKNTNSIR